MHARPFFLSILSPYLSEVGLSHLLLRAALTKRKTLHTSPPHFVGPESSIPSYIADSVIIVLLGSQVDETSFSFLFHFPFLAFALSRLNLKLHFLLEGRDAHVEFCGGDWDAIKEAVTLIWVFFSLYWYVGCRDTALL